MARPSRENLVRFAQEANEEYLFGHDNVVGVGTGLREKGGDFTDETCVQVFVQRKLSAEDLAPGQLIPARVPGFEGRGVRTDVIAAPIPEAQQDTSRYRPVPGGCSIGAEARVNAGTLGGWACDEADDTIVLVSNNHVISNLDNFPVLRRITQPGRFDGGVLPDDVIGRLKRHQVLNTVANPPTGAVPLSVVDAAIGSIDDDIEIDHDVIDIGPAVYEIRAPSIGMNVQKRGRTTLLTTNGQITTVGATFATTYRNRTRISRVQNAFRITSTDGNLFSDSGDSGSLIFDQAAGDLNGTLPVVGLLYAGGTFASGTPFTDANDINAVFGALNLTTACTCVGRAIIRAIFGARSAEEGRGAAVTERNLRRIRRQLADSDIGTTIDDLITRETARIGRIMARDDHSFYGAVEILAPLRERLTGPDVLEMPIDAELIGSVEKFTRELGRHEPDLGKNLKILHEAIKDFEGQTIGSVLDLVEPKSKRNAD